MESSAIEALMALASDSKSLLRSPMILHQQPQPLLPPPPPPPPPPPQQIFVSPINDPSIIKELQGMSDRYINNEPLLKESEKIEMFSEVPTSDSDEESLEVKRLRLVKKVFNFLISILKHPALVLYFTKNLTKCCKQFAGQY